jgi:hypothetical protein
MNFNKIKVMFKRLVDITIEGRNKKIFNSIALFNFVPRLGRIIHLGLFSLLLKLPYLGRTTPKGGIELYPNAFSDVETLVKRWGMSALMFIRFNHLAIQTSLKMD